MNYRNIFAVNKKYLVVKLRAPSHLENVHELVPGDVADGVPVEAPEGRLDLVVTVPGPSFVI